jgi:archaemetzincin
VVDTYGEKGMTEEATIAMVPFGVIPPNVLAELGPTVATNFEAKVIVAPSIALGSAAFDVRRGQYRSTEILRTLAAVKHENWERVLGIVDVDLYVPDLNFVFGEADMARGVAVFSLVRLQPRGSSREANALFLKRAGTEAIHELGHTYGLRHCRDPHCVMWFSNTLAESDRKGLTFCAAHASQLRVARRSE